MSRPTIRLARTLLLVALTAPWPALAGSGGATLEVSVRVVDRCTIEVPPALPPGLAWRAGGPHPAAHACAGGTPASVRAAPHSPVAGGEGPPGQAGGSPAAARSVTARGGHVLVTVSY